MGRKTPDMSGQRFGRLVVLAVVNKVGSKARLHCRCDCGKEKMVLPSNVRKGHTTSCGCLSAELSKVRAYELGKSMERHGMSRTQTYNSWRMAKARCSKAVNKNYALYGGRGITMCDRWFNSFDLFLADMGEKPVGFSIERLDNNKGYEPGNCVWATQETQCQNMRSNKMNADKVREARARVAAGESRKVVQADFGISESHLERLVSRKTWKNVE